MKSAFKVMYSFQIDNVGMISLSNISKRFEKDSKYSYYIYIESQFLYCCIF